MILPIQSFSSLLRNMSASLQGGAVQIIDLSIGSVLRALLEASASVALWMQWLILQVLTMTRAATSTGADLDSWMGDFSFMRLPGAPGSGFVTFSRYTLGLAATVPVGTAVKSSDGALTFNVVADPANPAWNGTSEYFLPSDITSVTVPVQAAVPGAAANVVAGAIGLLSSAIIGIDTVTNALPLAGGLDPESDIDFRGRFQFYINSRSLATANAVGAAIAGLQQGLRYAVLENVNLLGQPRSGNFCVIVDDGTGVATPTLLSAVTAAVESVRPLGTTYSVTAPVILPVSVAMNVRLTAGASGQAVSANIQQSILAWIDGLPMGGALAVSKLEAIAHLASASVASVSSTLINNLGFDVQAQAGSVIEPVSVTVTVS